MSYKQALEAAGAVVVEYEQFGTYQGDWFALVDYNGERGWVRGSYGSCSGCDAFDAEFGYNYGRCARHQYRDGGDCADCVQARADYDRRLAEFGRSYLEPLRATDDIRSELAKDARWDLEAEEALKWIDKIASREVGR